MKEIIKKYFQGWINKDISVIEKYFDDEIVYSECYGPEYIGKHECVKWFCEWNKQGNVLKWDIKNLYECEDTVITEWYFECEYQGEVNGFDGVSIIAFKDNKIISVKEFQSKADHHRPYQETKY